MKLSETLRRSEAAGGFRTNDLTLDFYQRVRALAPPSPHVVDFGAGRGEWLEDTSDVRRSLQDLRDIAARIVGVDVAPAVMTNPYLDEAHVIDGEKPLPLDDGWADVVVADWVLEHLDDPAWFVDECSRIVKPGGWVCARTTTRAGYVALGARVVPNVRHAKVLRQLQPRRKPEDVFPTRYRLNSVRAVASAFGDGWENVSFPVWPNLAYGEGKAVAERVERVWRAVALDRWAPVLYVFLRRLQPPADRP